MFLRRNLFLFASILFLAGFFVFVNLARAAASVDSSSVIITEIMYDPSGIDTKHEWVELKNLGAEAMEIKGGAGADSWRFFDGSNHTFATSTILSAGEYLILAQDDAIFLSDHPSFSGKVIKSSFDLGNTSSSIALRVGSGGALWSEIHYESSWGAAGNGKSLEKKNLAGANTSDNWQESFTMGGTPGADNSSPPSSVSNNISSSTTNASAQIFINEIYPVVATSSEKEWVELFNPNNFDVDLANYTLHDNSSTTTLSGNILANGFFVMEFSNRLNNDSDLLTLKNVSGTIIDKVAYGNYDDGNVSDNAPPPAAGQAVARPVDGVNSNNNKNDFVITLTPTKGAANKIESLQNNTNNSALTSPSAPAVSGSAATSFYGEVFISEFLSDPPANNSEWVELYNNSGTAISLSGWYIEEGSEEKTTLDGQIPVHGYFLLENPKGNLNNSGDIIFLYDAAGRLVDRVTYGKWNDGNTSDNAPAAFDGASVARKNFEHWGSDNTNFFVTTSPSPNGPNVFTSAQAQTKNNAIIAAAPVITASSSVMLNEILPNPAGPDETKEYMELSNNGETPINLFGWRLTSQNHKNYFFSTTSTIGAKDFLVLYRPESKIALHNTGGDFVELYDAANRLVDKVVYEDKAEDDFSYARFSVTTSVWKWTKALTPSRANILVEANFPPEVSAVVPASALVGEEITLDASDTFDAEGDDLSFNWDLGNGTKIEGGQITAVYDKSGNYKIVLLVSDGYNPPIEKKLKISVIGDEESIVAGGSAKKSSTSIRNKQIISASIADIKNLVSGDMVKTAGVITVPPGIFSSQIFYIIDPTSNAGISGYMFKKDFPNLVEGTKIGITGELTIASGAPRIKIKNKSDIQVFSSMEKFAPPAFSIDEIDNSWIGSLVQVSGEVAEVNSDNFYITDDTGEIMVQMKKNTELKSHLAGVGDKVIVTGIVGQNKNAWVLWPRFKDDVKITALGAGAKIKETSNNNLTDQYFTATAGGFTSLVLAFLMRGRAALAKAATAGVIGKLAFWKKNKLG